MRRRKISRDSIYEPYRRWSAMLHVLRQLHVISIEDYRSIEGALWYKAAVEVAYLEGEQ